MKVINTDIAEVKIIEPQLFGDDRGYFYESWQQKKFEALVTGKPVTFVQDNQSLSVKHTLRGLHLQLTQPQGKLIRVIHGDVFDVAVDMRPNSSTFGQWVGAVLSGENHKQLWVPQGFAHGFLVLSDNAICQYKCTDFYHPQSEKTLAWDDEDLNIDWPLEGHLPLLSEKDKQGLSLDELKKQILD